MTLGLIVSFFVTFLLLPSLINLIASENEVGSRYRKIFITSALVHLLKEVKSHFWFCIFNNYI